MNFLCHFIPSIMDSFKIFLLIILVLHNGFIAVGSHVIDSTELPSNQWPTQSVGGFKNSNSESLEEELQSLNSTNPRLASESAPESSLFSLEEEDDTVESFDDELDDIGQQRERPSEESQEEDGLNDIIVTTLVPTVLTEEETRVDEPTEKGPAEPTKENPASGSGIIINDGDTHLTTRPTVIEGKLLDEEDKLKEWKVKSQEDKLLGIKEFKPDDYIDDEPNDDDDEDDDDFFMEHDGDHAIDAVSDGMKQQNSNEKIVNRTKKELKEALYESGMFSRSTRNARMYINSPHEEEMLNFLIKLSKNPEGWSRVTEILGKMDYDTSSRLKTALQMEALNQPSKPQKTFSLIPSRSQVKPANENNVLKLHSFRSSTNLKSPELKSASQLAHKMSKENLLDDANKQRAKWHTTNTKIYNSGNNNNNNNGGRLPSNFEEPTRENDVQRFTQYHGPIDNVAIDVPGNNFYSNTNPKEKNKQAYIAVSIYKPNKQNYRTLDAGSSNTNNNLPLTFPITRPPHVSLNKNYAYHHGDDIPAVDRSQSNLPHVTFNKNINDKNRMSVYNQQKPTKKPKYGKNKNKFPKNGKNGDKKIRNKQKQSQKKEKMKQKQKQKQKMQQQQSQPTDNIEAQLLALSNMEQKLKQQMAEKEKLRQSLRTRHRTIRSSSM